MSAKATVILKNGQTVHLIKTDRVDLLAWLIRHDKEIEIWQAETETCEQMRQGREPRWLIGKR